MVKLVMYLRNSLIILLLLATLVLESACGVDERFVGVWMQIPGKIDPLIPGKIDPFLNKI